MEIFYIKTANFPSKIPDETVLALGFFDGVHLGHQQLITKAKEISTRKKLQLAVMTFYPHPKEIVQGGKFNYLMTLEEKVKKMELLGVDYLYVVNFNKEFARLSPETFVQQYISDLNVKHVVAGFDYTYGHKGMGTMDTIKEHGNGKFEVTVLPKVELDGIKISSTHIRNLLLKGDVKQIKSFMGSVYETLGQLVVPFSESNVTVRNDGAYMSNNYIYTFVPNNHCSIPCTGKYLVEVQSFNQRETAIAEVISIGKEIEIQLCSQLELGYNNRELYIKWLDSLENEKIMIEQQTKELVPAR
ncbi:cytidyltransferase [Sporosarcina soli]|uniref:FAD synthase n=1 Tax=Sporosarcina soli TaxID=334736 RepID=A0ABW0TIW0_9BACL